MSKTVLGELSVIFRDSGEGKSQEIGNGRTIGITPVTPTWFFHDQDGNELWHGADRELHRLFGTALDDLTWVNSGPMLAKVNWRGKVVKLWRDSSWYLDVTSGVEIVVVPRGWEIQDD